MKRVTEALNVCLAARDVFGALCLRDALDKMTDVGSDGDDKARLAKVTKPKCDGAWYLHSETQADDLAFFMLFSSVSATVGLAGGSSYSAANAYLDGLANWRKQRLSAMSVKWGPVSEVGMTAASGQADHLEAMALKTMSVAQVSSALRYLLSQQGGVAAVVCAVR